MSNNELKQAERLIADMAQTIEAPIHLIPTTIDRDGGLPHLEFSDGQFHYIISEKGKVLDRKSTTALEKLLYWVFRGVTFSMASDFEFKNRIKNKDSRRKIFDEQLRLLGMLNINWPSEYAKEIASVLAKAPFVDRQL